MRRQRSVQTKAHPARVRIELLEQSAVGVEAQWLESRGKIAKQRGVSRDETCIQKVAGCGPGAAHLENAFVQGADERLGVDRVCPERVADGLGYLGRGELSGVEEQDLHV